MRKKVSYTATRKGYHLISGDVPAWVCEQCHYYPPPEQVRAWFDQAGLAIEEGTGNGYAHLLARKGA